MFAYPKSVWVSLTILFAAFCSGGVWWYIHRAPQLDDLVRAAFNNAEQVVTYSQRVETETYVGDRKIDVVGEYRIDEKNQNFSSLATTTLTLPDGDTQSFTLHTITIGENMYSKVQSHSAGLSLSVPSSPEWKQFRANAIPTEYREIATPRPPLDNISLFRNAEKYLVLQESRHDESVGAEKFARYTFNLSSHAFTEKSGPVSMIAERLGVSGTVDIWVDAAQHIRVIRFLNTPYISTTTLTFINSLPPILPPLP